MQPCHHEVQREENLGIPEVLRFELESEPWHVMLDVFGVVLERFYAKEEGAERHRGDEGKNERASVPGLRRVNGERHGEAAGNEDGRVERPCPDQHLVACGRERGWIEAAIHA